MSRPRHTTRCYICEGMVGSRGEWNHFPVPKDCGGEETFPVCLPCHDMKDRYGLSGFEPGGAFAALSGLWRDATRDERIALALIIALMHRMANGVPV